MICENEFLHTIAKLDQNQRTAVYCDRNCVVSAGAGSGKTTVLSHRFVRLVLEQKAHVDEILTLTFTRKAAAEMHERIHRRLLKFSHDPYVAQELSRFPNATISTLDSFCKRIVVSDSVHYGIAPDFTLDDDANGLLAHECALSLLEDLKDHPGVKFLAGLYNPNDLVDSFFVGLATDFFHPATPFDPAAATVFVLTWLKKQHDLLAVTLKEICRKVVELDAKGKALQEAHLVCQQILYMELQSTDHLGCEADLALLEPLSIKKGQGKSAEVEIYNELCVQWKEVFGQFKAILAALADQEHIGRVYEVLGQYRLKYLQKKRQSGVLTFSDIATTAVDILKRNKPIRTYYKKKYKFVMIDEFQDNNQLQKDLLYLLSERDDLLVEGLPTVKQLSQEKLFFVGDEKQSIYLFRGADVSVFKQLDQELAGAGGMNIQLTTNYRSEPTLIDLFNHVFPTVMENEGEPYEANFTALSTREATVGMAPTISLWVKPFEVVDSEDSEEEGRQEGEEEENLSSVEAEAYTIACLIERMVSSDSYLILGDDRSLRRPHYNDIAILYRTASNQLHYEKALRVKDIPYTLSAVQSLFLEAPANDLYQMLQLTLYPFDRKAYVAALRSPFCHLGDPSILQILDSMDSETPPFGPLPDTLAFPPLELAKYEAASSVFNSLSTMAGTVPLANLIAYLWYDGGYRYLLLSDKTTQVYMEHAGYLLELARKYDSQGKGLSDFLDYLRPRLGQNEKLPDLELLREETHGVQMMTIHKSKGLEFPIVILANMGSSGRAANTPQWHSVKTTNGCIPVPLHMRPYGKIKNVFYEHDKPFLVAKETAEMKRLLYVAMTRAEAHLVLTGCENRQNRGESAYKKNLLALFLRSSGLAVDGRALGPNFSSYRIDDAPGTMLQSHVSQKKIADAVERLKPYYEQAEPVHWIAEKGWYGVTSLYGAEHELDIGMKGLESVVMGLPSVPADPLLLEYGLAADFGTWCHALIQKAIEGEAVDDPKDIMPHAFNNAAISERSRSLIAESAVTLSRNFLESDILRVLKASSPLSMEAEVEFAMQDIVDGKEAVLYGSIDFLVEYAQEICIVDFKTDFFKRPEIHSGQLRVYREAVSRIYQKPVRSALCYLRAPGGEVWEK